MVSKAIEELEKNALQHLSDYHNLKPTKLMEVKVENVLWLISQVKKFKKGKEKNAKLLRALATPKKKE